MKCQEMTEYTAHMQPADTHVRLDKQGIHLGSETLKYSQVVYTITEDTVYNSLAIAFQSMTNSGMPHIVFHVMRFSDPFYLGMLSSIIKASIKIEAQTRAGLGSGSL